MTSTLIPKRCRNESTSLDEIKKSFDAIECHNLYLYEGGNPINRLDPMGLQTLPAATQPTTQPTVSLLGNVAELNDMAPGFDFRTLIGNLDPKENYFQIIHEKIYARSTKAGGNLDDVSNVWMDWFPATRDPKVRDFDLTKFGLSKVFTMSYAVSGVDLQMSGQDQTDCSHFQIDRTVALHKAIGLGVADGTMPRADIGRIGHVIIDGKRIDRTDGVDGGIATSAGELYTYSFTYVFDKRNNDVTESLKFKNLSRAKDLVYVNGKLQ